MATKVCSECGHSAGKTAKFCKECGKPIPTDADPGNGPETPLFGEEALENLEAAAAEGTAAHPGTGSVSTPPAETPTAQRCPDDDETFIVEVLNGLGAGTKTRVPLDRPLVIGADPAADIAFTDDAYASRRHATLTIKEGKLLLHDENSTNGTFLRISGTRQVVEGDLIIAGRTVLRICSEE